MKLNEEEICILQSVLDCAKIGADIPDKLQDMKENKVKKIHPYKITSPKKPDAKWMTYVKDLKGNRQKITAHTEAELFRKLFKHYFGKQNHTLRTLYPLWIEKRKSENVNPRTLRRNENHWDKYYAPDKIVDEHIENLTPDMIEGFFHSVIREYNLTVKELNNMKFVFAEIMKLAKRRNFIAENPFTEIKINTNGCKPAKKQNDSSRVYLTDEREILFRELEIEMKNYPDNTDVYAILLLFKLGLRIGEAVALKWTDIDTRTREIHIHRMETVAPNEKNQLRPTVVEYTKKKSLYGDRFLPLGNYEFSLFQTIAQINERNGCGESEFIFCDEKGRTKIRALDNRIRKLCTRANLPVKSAHDIRRTVASEMFNNGVPVEIIRDYLGHSDIKTTWGYILDNQGKEKTAQMVLKSLQTLDFTGYTQQYSIG